MSNTPECPIHGPANAFFDLSFEEVADKYVYIQFVTIDEHFGQLTPEQIEILKLSKANSIVLKGVIYKLNKIEDDLYRYISLAVYDNSEYASIKEIALNIVNGQYVTKYVYNIDEEIIQRILEIKALYEVKLEESLLSDRQHRSLVIGKLEDLEHSLGNIGDVLDELNGEVI